MAAPLPVMSVQSGDHGPPLARARYWYLVIVASTGSVQLSSICSLPAVAVRPPGAPGGGFGVALALPTRPRVLGPLSDRSSIV